MLYGGPLERASRASWRDSSRIFICNRVRAGQSVQRQEVEVQDGGWVMGEGVWVQEEKWLGLLCGRGAGWLVTIVWL